MPKLHPVTVEISTEGAITCKDKGGHVHAARADQVAWTGKNVKFTLIFKDFVTGAPAWPFTIPEPSVSWPRGNFNATLKDEGIPKYYKYTVQISGYADLDPIIIVDK
jgi:hypothetical protein